MSAVGKSAGETSSQDLSAPLESVLDALPIVACIIRPDGQVTYASPGWQRLTGHDAGVLTDGQLRSVLSPEQLDEVIERWDAARAAGVSYRDEFQIRFADGNFHWMLMQAEPLRAADGASDGWFATFVDISARKNAERVLLGQVEFTERLIDSSDDCIKVLDLDGRLISMNPNGQRLLRITNVDALIGSSWIEFWHGEDREAARRAVDAALAGNTGNFTGFFPVEGEPRWFAVTVRPIFDAAGVPERLLSVSRDITIQRAANRALRENEQRFRALSEALPGLTWTASPAGAIDFVGDRWNSMRGIDRSAALGDGWLDALHPEDRDAARRRWVQSTSTGIAYEAQYRIAMPGGKYRWHVSRATPMLDESGEISRWVGVTSDIDDERRADLERTFLANASHLLSRGLDLQELLETLTNLVIPRFADWCQVDLHTVDGHVATAIVAHRDPARRVIARAFTDSIAGEAGVKRSANSDAYDAKSRISSVAPAGASYAELGVKSAATIPIMALGAPIGTITLVFAESGRTFNDDDLPMLEEFGRRAGVAIQNVTEFAREHRVATTFQRASLPQTLLRVPGIIFDAEYLPGSDEATIGGDWYDTFLLDDGRIAITIGDVIGHGIDAAVTMTKVKQAMQAAAMIQPDPNVMLDVADKTLARIEGDGYATALAAIYDGARHTLSFASAGHPGPLVCDASGTITDYTTPGIMLGLRSGADSDVTVIDVSADCSIVFFTDGLIESTRNAEAGVNKLREAIARHDVMSSVTPAKAIAAFVLGSNAASDDVAILVAQTARQKTPGESAAHA